MEKESLNIAVLRGICSSPAEIRVLASEDVLVQLQVTTRVAAGALSVPVSVLNPPAWVEQLDTGAEIVVAGHIRRRFFRATGTTASRVEVEADVIAKASDRRRAPAFRRTVAALLESLEE